MIVVFSAMWCPTCGPHKDALTRKGVKYTVCDIDEDPDRAAANNIRGLPTTIIYDDEENELARWVGSKSTEIAQYIA